MIFTLTCPGALCENNLRALPPGQSVRGRLQLKAGLSTFEILQPGTEVQAAQLQIIQNQH